jgi:hypothetical protein
VSTEFNNVPLTTTTSSSSTGIGGFGNALGQTSRASSARLACTSYQQDIQTLDSAVTNVLSSVVGLRDLTGTRSIELSPFRTNLSIDERRTLSMACNQMNSIRSQATNLVVDLLNSASCGGSTNNIVLTANTDVIMPIDNFRRLAKCQ